MWDASTVAALDSVITKYERRGITVELQGLNDTSLDMRERLAGHLAGCH